MPDQVVHLAAEHRALTLLDERRLGHNALPFSLGAAGSGGLPVAHQKAERPEQGERRRDHTADHDEVDAAVERVGRNQRPVARGGCVQNEPHPRHAAAETLDASPAQRTGLLAANPVANTAPRMSRSATSSPSTVAICASAPTHAMARPRPGIRRQNTMATAKITVISTAEAPSRKKSVAPNSSSATAPSSASLTPGCSSNMPTQAQLYPPRPGGSP